ncbi:polyribonucleotide nucleotidyltransferase [Thermospira aquatica]|uniref:Polyribonucleotide nucleotidyltransferase n=1 Tax=Thermospira aquatica TaxID=2828656 RepID=A0AAX3BD71_9SPIR|nr:polyribonucleotide nucleotidyltransferase [Thermospira aquatica]URA10189.1 polyribonucleotide nucleotidyltransferase [Thermospira aquatica]
MSFFTVKGKVGDKEIVLETGKMAKQADGAVLVKSGGNAVLVTACMSKEVPEGIDFFPLTVHYQEKFYAAGKIPGGYFKREGKPTEKEILVSRLIDRPIRPLFPENFYNEVQVIASTLSADQVYSTDVLGIIGASAALSISPIPFLEPIGAVRIAYMNNGRYIVNPSMREVEESLLDIVVGGTKEGLTMVEGGAHEVSKDVLLEALRIAHIHIKEEIALIEELVDLVKPEKLVIQEPAKILSEDLRKQIREASWKPMREAAYVVDKKARAEAVDNLKKTLLEQFGISEEHAGYNEAKTLLDDIEIEVIRETILTERVRPDGRKPDEIRPITIELDLLENVHGSALFTRGQTQSLGIVTLGSTSDVQYVDSMEEEESKRFMLHYNFPPFSTGEVKRTLAPSRREIGHGHLAYRAIEPILPTEEEFPYTIRVVSEILESNGSSSMATVCSSSLALMATGVPIRKPVAGIAMGLVWNKERGDYCILSDIQGLEDHFGDMDFKVAGTKDGITAFQMDVKTIGLTQKMMEEALDQALAGQAFILSRMNEAIAEPRPKLSANAPKIKVIYIPESTIGQVIGTGGRVIKRIMEETQTTISIDDDGRVAICGKRDEDIERCLYIVNHIVNGFEKGEKVEGKVIRIEDYGVFLELIPGESALLHRSNMKEKKPVRSTYQLGQVVQAMVTDIDEKHRIVLKEL